MLTPGQNYDHLLDPISGYDGMHDLQLSYYLEPTTNNHRGSLMSISDNGLIQVGMASLHAMPMWAINASYDFDVAGGVAWPAGGGPLYRSDAGNIAGQTLAKDNSTVLRRHVGCFVATGGFELVTTEFNQGATYNENTPLIAYTPTGGEATGSYPLGWVTPGTILVGGELALEEQIVGIVSLTDVTDAAGISTEVYDQKVIRFWPVYLPARAVTP
jgi:hypothetical protein